MDYTVFFSFLHPETIGCMKNQPVPLDIKDKTS